MPELAIMDRDFAPARPFSIEHARDYPRSRLASPAREPARFSTSRPGSARSATPGSPGRAAKQALAIALGASAIAALALVVALPLTEIRGLTVVGATSVSPEELAAWAGIRGGAHWFSVDCAAAAEALAAHPRVSSVSVTKRFPNSVVASVAERAPVAVVYAKAPSGRVEAHCVDGDGVVFAPASEYAEAEGLPVLSGLEIRGLRYGLRLEGPFSGLLSSLAELRASNPALVAAISELRLVSREGSPAELLVYPARYRVPVRMRPVLNASLLKSMMLVLDVVEGQGLSASIRELDMRTDTFVYRTKEAVSG